MKQQIEKQKKLAEMTAAKTLREGGYFMPAEWEEHEGTWLQWHQNTRYEIQLESIWLAMVDALHGHENVLLIVSDEKQRDHVADQLAYHGIGLKNVDFYLIETDDIWARDNGPIFVVNNQGQVMDDQNFLLAEEVDAEVEERPEESHAAWQTVQQGHAAANACYLAAVNRVEIEEAPDGSGRIHFWGGSFLADLSGQLIKKASMQDEENLLCAVDLGCIERIRNISSYPFRDRRVDSYHDLTKLYSS